MRPNRPRRPPLPLDSEAPVPFSEWARPDNQHLVVRRGELLSVLAILERQKGQFSWWGRVKRWFRFGWWLSERNKTLKAALHAAQTEQEQAHADARGRNGAR